MSYFPIFINIHSSKVLVVGGGAIATQKLEKLVDFTQDITVIAVDIEERAKILIEEYRLTVYKRAYKRGDIKGFDMVIVATDTPNLHREIYQESRGSRILVNSVDSIEYCDFIFPAYIKRDDLTIAFSTGGASPAFTKQIRSHFENSIPKSVGEFLKKMKSLRATIPKGKDRMRYFDTLVSEYFSKCFK